MPTEARADADDFITIGSNKAHVARVQGPPSSTGSRSDLGFEGELWCYDDAGEAGTGMEGASSVIHFDRAGRVEGWMNQGGLTVGMPPGPNTTTSAFFSAGSHRDDVARLQGVPYSVVAPSRLTRAEVRRRREFEREMREISREIGKPPLEPVYGPEDENDDLEVWRYPGGMVEFSASTGRVTAWDDTDGSLKVSGVGPETETARRRRAFEATRQPNQAQPETDRARASQGGGGCLLPVMLGLGLLTALVALGW